MSNVDSVNSIARLNRGVGGSSVLVTRCIVTQTHRFLPQWWSCPSTLLM